MRIAVCGLGRMGTVFAENLLAAGHQVTVWNRTPSRLSKDLALAIAGRSDLPVAKAAAQLAGDVVRRGHGDHDISVLGAGHGVDRS